MNALVLIVLGAYGYAVSGSPTALIADGVGLILLVLSFPVKRESSSAAHAVVVITLITAVAFTVVGFMRSNLVVLVMALFTLLALIIYIKDFVRRKKEREASS